MLNNRYETAQDSGAPRRRSENPLSRLAARQRELEGELAAARKASRRGRYKDDLKPWLIQAAQTQEEDGWFMTYMDMMTLLLVLLIVMLSFAGKGAANRNIPAIGHAGTALAQATPALTHVPAASPLGKVITPIPAGIGVLPAANGLLPEIGIHHEHHGPVENITQPPDARFARGEGLPPTEIVLSEGAVPTASADANAGAGIGRKPAIPESAASTAPSTLPEEIRLSEKTATIDDATPAANLASTENQALPEKPAESENTAPSRTAKPEPKPAETAENMLAGLPLSELGDDIDIIVNERTVSFRINSEILFSSGEADLSLAGLAVLKRLVPVFNSVKHKITVEGHTDSVPMLRNRHYPSNWELSGARAASVVRYLEANGVARARLRAIGNADTRPLADNNTPEGRASNRRVELIMERQED